MVSFDDVEIGEEVPPFTVQMDRDMYKQYNRLVHEINPLHFNEKYAQGLGFKAIVVAGVFTYSYFLRPILSMMKKPSAIKKIQIRFHEPVYIEDTITHRTIIRKKYTQDGVPHLDCEVWVENQDGQKVTSGTVTLIF